VGNAATPTVDPAGGGAYRPGVRIPLLRAACA
jgi:hypothetical protein